MDYCSRSLAELKEYETDELIPYLVRNQELSRRVVDTFSYDDIDSSEIKGEFLVGSTSNAFLQELDRLRLEWSPTSQNNSENVFYLMKVLLRYNLLTNGSALLELEFHIISVTINEAALHKELWSCERDSGRSSNLIEPSAARIKFLWRSLSSCKDFVNTFLSFRDEDLFYLTVFIYPKLCYVFITLARLVFLDSDSAGTGGLDQPHPQRLQNQPWSVLKVAEEANFQGLGQRVLDRFAAVSTDFVGADGQLDAMATLGSAMRILMTGYEQQIVKIQQATNRAEAPDSVVEMISEHYNITVDPDSYSSIEDTGEGNVSAHLDTDFAQDSSANIAWNDILENFRMIPASWESDLGLRW
jgi:hypothetical protein